MDAAFGLAVRLGQAHNSALAIIAGMGCFWQDGVASSGWAGPPGCGSRVSGG